MLFPPNATTPEVVLAGPSALASDGSFVDCARHGVHADSRVLAVWFSYTRGTSGGLALVRVDWVACGVRIPDTSPTGDATETADVLSIEIKTTEAVSPPPQDGSAHVVLHKFDIPPGADGAIVRIAEADATKASPGTIAEVTCAAR